MADYKENITSIFSYIPKEIPSEASFVWLVNLLSSDAKDKKYTQIFLESIALKKEDIGQRVASIGIISHEPGHFCRVVVSFPRNRRQQGGTGVLWKPSAYQTEAYYSVTSTLSPALIDTYIIWDMSTALQRKSSLNIRMI